MSETVPERNFSFTIIQIIFTVGVTLLILKWSPASYFFNQGLQGPAGTSCQVHTVRYDPNGGAILAFKCGKNIREVTIARGKTGPKGDTGPQGKTGSTGASCSVLPNPDRPHQVTFKCGKQTYTLRTPHAPPKTPKKRTLKHQKNHQEEPKKTPPNALLKRPQAVEKHALKRVSAIKTSTPRTKPLSPPSLGPKHAKVKVVVFSDFQCPFCVRGYKTMHALRALYKDRVQFIFRHLPLPFHSDAHLAAQASMAAHAQGQFWKYHDVLFQNQSRLKRSDLLRYARQLNLNMVHFQRALDTKQYKSRIDLDIRRAKQKQASGTPTFFVNGQKIAGALPLAYFKKVIHSALKGQKAAPFLAPKAAQPKPSNPSFPTPDFNQVKPGKSPSWGPDSAPITVIEFSDFECGFCARAVSILAQLKREYKKDIRIVFKHMPLPFHPHAHLAAQASMAAHAQGQFWKYHDALFADTKNIQRPQLLRIARQLKLNMSQFTRALDTQQYKSIVDANIKQAQALRVRGTPTFFINGYRVAGAFPFAYFKQVIQAIQQGKKPPAFSPPNKTAPPKRIQRRVSIRTQGAPVWGHKTAQVTLVEFSDFECSFCARGAEIMRKVKKVYGDKVRLVFKHSPLSFHKNAHIAAQASMAAHAQGQFWKYHDLLFKNSTNLSSARLRALARQAGLNMQRFDREMQQGLYKEYVTRDLQEANRLGAVSTPSFFVNGIHILGARPFFYFKQAIDAALEGRSIAKAIKKHTTKSQRRVRLSLQGAPSVGPQNAKVTVVEFSDFECSFCATASKTLNRLKKEYKGKVRFVFKHLPLRFHKKAKWAATAAMAAHEQGKFWEYHDLLFQHQSQLGRPLYIQLARQLKLNMSAFRNVLDRRTYRQYIEQDYQEGRWAGADGTPAFFVNGRRMMGVVPYAQLKRLIDAILAGKTK